MSPSKKTTAKPITHCGFAAIIGRPNVGKSTLLNHILGQKISITSKKPQTTRFQILGIKTVNEVQTVYMDTPGLHKVVTTALNRYMNKAASSVIRDADVIVFMIEALQWRDEDKWILGKLTNAKAPVILAVNKVDKVPDKGELLPFIQQVSELYDFAAIIPLSAEKGDNIPELEKKIASFLPEQPFIFPEDQITDKSQRFLAGEIIREKLMRNLGQELPYSLTVEIEEFEEKKDIIHITACIWVEKEGQKVIIIGTGGDKLKQVGRQARLELEHWFDSKIFLKLWVRVKSNWADDQRALKNLGYQ